MRGRGQRCENNYPTTRGKGLRSETTDAKKVMGPSEEGIRSSDAMLPRRKWPAIECRRRLLGLKGQVSWNSGYGEYYLKFI